MLIGVVLFVVINLQVVNRYKGANYPIMNVHERVLSVLTNRVRMTYSFFEVYLLFAVKQTSIAIFNKIRYPRLTYVSQVTTYWQQSQWVTNACCCIMSATVSARLTYCYGFFHFYMHVYL